MRGHIAEKVFLLGKALNPYPPLPYLPTWQPHSFRTLLFIEDDKKLIWPLWVGSTSQNGKHDEKGFLLSISFLSQILMNVKVTMVDVTSLQAVPIRKDHETVHAIVASLVMVWLVPVGNFLKKNSFWNSWMFGYINGNFNVNFNLFHPYKLFHPNKVKQR